MKALTTNLQVFGREFGAGAPAAMTCGALSVGGMSLARVPLGVASLGVTAAYPSPSGRVKRSARPGLATDETSGSAALATPLFGKPLFGTMTNAGLVIGLGAFALLIAAAALPSTSVAATSAIEISDGTLRVLGASLFSMLAGALVLSAAHVRHDEFRYDPTRARSDEKNRKNTANIASLLGLPGGIRWKNVDDVITRRNAEIELSVRRNSATR